MNSCNDVFLLSTIACKLSECLTEDELALLAINLTTLGDLLQTIATRQAICSPKSST